MSDNVIDVTIRAKDETSSGLSSAESGFSGLGKSAAAGMAVAAAAVAGVALAVGKLGEAFAQAMDMEAANDKLAAQLGLSAQASEEFGRTAGKLYAGAYGESLDEVNEALRYVQQNIGEGMGNADDALQTVTGSVLDLAAAFGEDLGPISRAVGTMVKAGIVGDATQALDLLTVGFQNGTNAGEDLLDTMSEYSIQFRELGISAEMALGLMSQGMKAGARDSDFLADAIKEFAIRSKDGSKLSAEAFAAIGLDANKMFKTFATGGPPAQAAMGDVIKRLKAMKDPVEQDATAVALFGTKAEDLQDSLYALDPTTAVASLGQVEGAAARMGTTLADNAATKLEAFKRTLQMALVNFLKDTVLPQVVSTVESLGPAFDRVREIAERVAAGVKDAWSLLTTGFTTDELATNLGALGEPIRAITDRVRELAADWLPKLQDAWGTVSVKISEFWTAIKGNESLLITLGVAIGGVLVLAVYSLVAAFASLAVSVLAATLPFVAVGAAIFALIAGLRYAYENWEWFRTGVDTVVQWLTTNVPPIFEQIRAAVAVAFEWIMNVAVPFIQQAFASFVGFLQGTLLPAVSDVWNDVASVIQFASSIVMEIVGRISAFISDNWNWISGVAAAVWAQITNLISTAWQIISNIFQLFLNIISGNWEGAWQNIQNILGAAAGFLVGTVQNLAAGLGNVFMVIVSAAGNLAGGVLGKLNELRGWFMGLPGQLIGALASLGSDLFNAGVRAIQSLIDGIRSKIGGAVDAVKGGLSSIRNLLPFSPAKEGPFSGRGYPLYSGQAIAGSLAEGIRNRTSQVRQAANGLVEAANGAVRSPSFLSQQGVAAGAGGGAQHNWYVQGSILSERDLIGVVRREFDNRGLR